MSEDKTKFFVKVYEIEKPIRVAKEIQDSLKGAAGGKMLKRMKKEAIDCSVLNKQRAFLECFACPNFLRRVKGQVECIGNPLPETP